MRTRGICKAALSDWSPKCSCCPSPLVPQGRRVNEQKCGGNCKIAMKETRIRIEKAYQGWFTSASGDPLSSFGPFLVEKEKTALPSSFDELVGFRDELGGEDPWWEGVIGGDSVGRCVPFDLSDVWCWVDKALRDLSLWRDSWSPCKPVGEQEFRVVLVDSYKINNEYWSLTMCSMSSRPLEDMVVGGRLGSELASVFLISRWGAPIQYTLSQSAVNPLFPYCSLSFD